MSSLSRHAGRPHIETVLVQNHHNDLSTRIALEVESRIDNLVKKLVLGAREDREGGLPRELCFEMIALERNIEHGTEIEPVFADVIAERGGVERDFPEFGRQLGRVQLRGHSDAVLVQPQSVHYAIGIASEAHASLHSLGEKLIGCRREN